MNDDKVASPDRDRQLFAYWRRDTLSAAASTSTGAPDEETVIQGCDLGPKGLRVPHKKAPDPEPPDQWPTQTTQLRQGADSRRGTNDCQLCQHGMLKTYMKCYENHHPI